MIYLGNSPVGVGLEGCGEFKKHQQLKVTPQYANESRIDVAHNLGAIPKLIIVSCEETDAPYTTNGYIRYFVATPVAGASWGVTSNTAAQAWNGFSPTDTIGNGKYTISATEVDIYQVGSTVKWSKDTEYTVDIYA